MTLPESGREGKSYLGRILVLLTLLLTASASFGLGMLAERDFATGSTNSLQARGQGSGFSISTTTLPEGGQVVASKNGTKYFLPWCGGADTILEANKIWFASKEEAEAKGYSPAANCKGL